MLLSMSAILGIFTLCTSVVAHGQVSGIVAGGKYYPGYLPQLGYQKSPQKVAGWSIPRDVLNGPVYPASYKNPDIICHIGATPGAVSVVVAAGQTVELQWTPWPVTHHGPVIDYLANCNGPCSEVDKTRLRFNKVDATGLLRNSPAAGQPGYWAADRLREANNSWTVTVPSTTAAGNYVLRHEIIALHDAIKVNGAQNYPHCINLEVTGSGSDKLASGTLGINLYRATDPGIEIDIYKPLVYQMPGPPVHGAASFTPAQAGSYGLTAMKAAKIKAPAVPKVPIDESLKKPGAGTNGQTPSTAAPTSLASPSSTASENVIPSGTEEPSQRQLNNSGTGNEPKVQALNSLFQPHHDATDITTIPKNTEPDDQQIPANTELNTTNPDSNAETPAASLPQQNQKAGQPSLAPSSSAPLNPSPKKKKPCNCPPTSSTSPSAPSPSQNTGEPTPAPSSPSKKKLKKKPCTRGRPGVSTPVPPQAQNAPPASTAAAPPSKATSGTKKLKEKPCKRRRRRSSEL